MKTLSTLKQSLIHTFTGVATERELFYSFLIIGLPTLAVYYSFFHHVTI